MQEGGPRMKEAWDSIREKEDGAGRGGNKGHSRHPGI